MKPFLVVLQLAEHTFYSRNRAIIPISVIVEEEKQVLWSCIQTPLFKSLWLVINYFLTGHDMKETEEDTEAQADMREAETTATIEINMEATPVVVAAAAAVVANLK